MKNHEITKELKVKEEKLYNVFVYCGRKSGSRTLNYTFLKNDFRSFHVHNNIYYICTYHKPCFKLKNVSGIIQTVPLTPLQNSSSVFELINSSCKVHDDIFIFDVYRTPIERKISCFFQNIKSHLPNYKNLKIDELINFFNTNLLYELEEYHSINEVLTNYNIPLFTKFDFEKKYNLVKQSNKIFIKLLFKDIDKWDKILSEIFQKEITLHPSNLTKNKPDIYVLKNEFFKNYKIPKKYIEEKLKNDVEFKIYNTEEEQSEYIKKWLESAFDSDSPSLMNDDVSIVTKWM